jgi:hypothetical protein
MNHTRRNTLKSLSLGAGSFLLSPFLRQVELQAAGNSTAIPHRFVFVVKSSGIIPDGITPDTFRGKDSNSSLFNQDLTNVPLPSSMQALEPFNDQLSIVQGLSGKMCRGGHSSWFGMMGVYMTGGEFDAGAVIRATADAELAKLNPAPFNHLGLAIRGKALSSDYGGTMYPGISAVGPGQELPFQGSPDIAYEQLFGSAVAASSGAEKVAVHFRNGCVSRCFSSERGPHQIMRETRFALAGANFPSWRRARPENVRFRRLTNGSLRPACWSV